jgi:chromosome segregation ATPase
MSIRRIVVYWVAASLPVSPLFAETVRHADESAAMMIKVQQMQQKIGEIGAERDALKAQNEKLAAEKAALERQLEQARKKQAGSEETLDKYRESDAALRNRINEDRARMQELIDKFKEIAQTLRQVEADRNELRSTASQQRDQIVACTKKNLELYRANLDLLDRYKSKGVWASLLQREPVTGLKRVEIENMIEEYRTRLDQLQVVGAVDGK